LTIHPLTIHPLTIHPLTIHPLTIHPLPIQLVLESDPTIHVAVPKDFELALAVIFSLEVGAHYGGV
jgi:hypothetical protein